MQSIEHGPLELLMTVREEVGLEGVQALDGSMVTGSILVNLDSEEDGQADHRLCRQHRHLDPHRRRARAGWVRTTVALTVTVSGGKGGHSGSNISHGHSNAVKALGRALRETLGNRARSASRASPAARAATRSRATPPRSVVIAAGREQGFRERARVCVRGHP